MDRHRERLVTLKLAAAIAISACMVGSTRVRTGPRWVCEVAIRGLSLSRSSFRSSSLHALPDQVDATAGAMVEPGANSLRAAWGAAIEPGTPVLVLGAGTIGLLAAQFAVAQGAEVTVADRSNGHLRFAASLGGFAVYDIEQLPTVPYDAVIDAVERSAAARTGSRSRSARRTSSFHRPRRVTEPARHSSDGLQRRHGRRDPQRLTGTSVNGRAVRIGRGRSAATRRRNDRSRRRPCTVCRALDQLRQDQVRRCTSIRAPRADQAGVSGIRATPCRRWTHAESRDLRRIFAC